MSHLEYILKGAFFAPKVFLRPVVCLLFLFTVGLSLSGYSQGQNSSGIQGAVTNSKSMSVDAAKAEAFLEARPVIDMSEFPKIDPHYFENREAIKSRRDRVGNHIYTKFESGLYSVSTVCENRVFYYRQNGELQMVEEETSPSYYNSSCKTTFPKKSYKYTYPSGRLTGVSIDTNSYESFVFTPEGVLMTHWLGNQCRDINGELCGLRRSFRNMPPKSKIKRVKI